MSRALLQDLSWTQAETILRARTVRILRAIEGWAAIHTDDHPAIVQPKRETYFVHPGAPSTWRCTAGRRRRSG